MLLLLLGVLVGAVAAGVDVVVVVAVEFEMAVVVGAEVVWADGVGGVLLVEEGVTGFSWLPKKGCRRIPELAWEEKKICQIIN